MNMNHDTSIHRDLRNILIVVHDRAQSLVLHKRSSPSGTQNTLQRPFPVEDLLLPHLANSSRRGILEMENRSHWAHICHKDVEHHENFFYRPGN